MLVEVAEREYRGPQSESGVRHPPIMANMDDLTVTTKSVTGGRWLLKGLERNIEWSRLQFTLIKSRSLVIKRGKVIDKHRFSVAGSNIPTLTEKLIKSMGKTFNNSLKDTISTRQTIDDLNEALAKIYKSGLPGRFKALIYSTDCYKECYDCFLFTNF